MRGFGTAAGVCVFAVLLAACSSSSHTSSAGTASSCPLPTFGAGKDYRPVIRPSNFTANVDNPWFPLRPGTTLVYTGTKDGKPALDLFAPSSRTRTIDGVQTRIVEDRLFLDNRLEEKTSDYYAQDRCGNVWYFGEDTATLDGQGRAVDRSGSFHAGVNGAQPGLFMQSRPEANRSFRQEWAPGEAEDQFRTLELTSAAKVPYGSFPHALRTEEQTALEPGVLDNKQYVRGIGEIIEESVKGPVEKLVLVDVLS